MSLMSSLYTGVSGLQASQNALNATAHNITNANTTGYVRQQVVLTDNYYTTIGQSYFSLSQIGSGVTLAAVRQVRDSFLDKSYRTEVGREGYYDEQSAAVTEVESLFGELEGVAFQEALTDLQSAMEELAKEPDSTTARTALIETAVSFLERAQDIYDQLLEYQSNLNGQVQKKVGQINSLGDQIDELNEQILKAESNGENANDLRDARNSCLDELAQLASITYSENSDGVVRVSIEGVQFVTESSVHYLATETISDTSDLLTVVWENTGREVFNLEEVPSSDDDTDIGSLKGLLVARGSDTANYTDIPVCPEEEDYATEEEYLKAQAVYAREVEVYNTYVDSSIIMATLAQFDQLINGIVTAINDILSPTAEVTFTDGSTGEEITITVLDEENASVGMDNEATVGLELFTRTSAARYEERTYEVLLEDGTTELRTYQVYIEEDAEDENTLYTLGNIEVNEELLSDCSKLALSTGTGEVDYETAQALMDLWDNSFATLNPNSTTENTFMEYYTALAGEIAGKGEVFNTICDSQASMVESIDGQRMSVTGVSTDEELTNLIKFQHAYNAASRYITVIDEMLNQVISML